MPQTYCLDTEQCELWYFCDPHTEMRTLVFGRQRSGSAKEQRRLLMDTLTERKCADAYVPPAENLSAQYI